MKRLLPLLLIILTVTACAPAVNIMGLEDVMPDGWVAGLEDSAGQIGSPLGLEEALIRIDFHLPDSSFEAKGKEVNPSLTLWFYPLHLRNDIIQVIQESADQFGDIPIFFVLSNNYVIVTSSVGFNHGYHGHEAAPLVPLEAALKQHFSETR